MTEYWYNTTFHTATNTTPYQIVYGQSTPLHRPYLSGISNVDIVDISLQSREPALKLLKFHMMRAQQKMKNRADKNKIGRKFQVGDYLSKAAALTPNIISQSCQYKVSCKIFWAILSIS